MSQTKEIIIEITKISDLGKGVAIDQNGKKIFVSKTTIGDKIKAKIHKENNKFIAANLVEIINSGVSRSEAPCPHFSKCGGCELQHLKDDFYKEYKENIILDLLSRNKIDLSEKIKWLWIGKSSRRRVNFHISSNNQIGFFEEFSNNLVPIDNCLMLEEKLAELILPLKTLLQTLPQDLIHQVSATKFDNGIDLIFHCKDFSLDKKTSEKLIDFAKTNQLIALNSKVENHLAPIYQSAKPELFFNKIKIELPSDIFLQATKSGANQISAEINNFISSLESKSKPIFIADLYSGIGAYSFSICDLEIDCKIDAFEGERLMAESINKNAIKNNLGKKIKAFARDLVKNPIRDYELKKYDLILINPPRSGAKSQAEILAKSAIKNIIMISCNPYSFFVDARILLDAGYKISKLTAIDQFYYTHHLEIVVVFSMPNN